MTSTTETGHEKNIAAFKTILNTCQGYGAEYNPVANNLQLANLQTQLANMQAAQADFIKKQAKLSNTVDQRAKAFAQLKPLTTKVLNALTVSGVDKLSIETAKTITRKIFGKRAQKLPENTDPNSEQANNISVAQLSFTNQVAHFIKLQELLAELPLYKPNETPIQLAQLQSYTTALQTINDTLMQATNDFGNAKIIRNKQLYSNTTGLVETGYLIKAYVKSIYGPLSPQYKLISGIKLTRKKEIA